MDKQSHNIQAIQDVYPNLSIETNAPFDKWIHFAAVSRAVEMAETSVCILNGFSTRLA